MDNRVKKIAVISDTAYPFFKGGKEKRIYDITTRLAARGYDVTIYCMKWWKENDRSILQNGVKLKAISPYYPIYAGKRRSIREAIFFALNCLRLVTKDFDVIDIDHMPHLVLFTTKIVCILKKKKMVVTWNEVWGKKYWQEYLGAAGTLAYMIEWISARLPDTIISISEHTTNDLRTVLGIKGPIITIPNGVDVEGISKIPAAAKGADVVFAGRLLSHKNVDVLIRAIAIVRKQHPEILTWIAGEGPEKESLQKLTHELDLEKNIIFLGFLPDEHELYRIMKASRMFVLPSTREGFGIVIVEANACGIPVITIDHEQNAGKDLITDGGNGALVKLDEAELARAIEKLLSSKRDPATYLSYAEKYDWTHILSKIENAYLS
jgi:glycosyltransferase involved in cell wall biosynthesis